ncbi:MAG: hypothetical protein ACD_52C00290G0005 [uncultured bacterium]|nr:MAG: hypothetical protein ACD_52C00290G0005 [uncultured bacterium]
MDKNVNITCLIAIKAFYETNNDFIDAFSYFSLQAITEISQTLSEIQKRILEMFGLTIPTDVLKTLLNRLRKNGFVEYKDIEKDVLLTDSGLDQTSTISEKVAKSEREMNALVTTLKKYNKGKFKIDLTAEETKDKLSTFVKNHLASTCLTLQKPTVSKTSQPGQDAFENALVSFVTQAKKSDSKSYDQLKSLAYGTIIASILQRDGLDSVSRKFHSLDIFLDTNIIFSAMGFDDETLNTAAKEFLEYAKKSNFSLKIFSITKHQIISFLSGYEESYDNFVEKIPVDSIYYRLKQLGYSKQDVQLLINNIEERLNKLGIEIDYTQEDIEFQDFSNKLRLLGKYKQDSIQSSLQHDFACLFYTKRIRGSQEYLIEHSKAIFLTDDKKLTDYNLVEWGHRSQKPPTIPEAVLRNFFVNLLWLKSPDLRSELPIHNIIAGCEQKLLISTSLWHAFLRELKKHQDKNDLSEDDIHLLISSNETKKLLFEIETGLKKVNELAKFIPKEVSRKILQNRKMDEELKKRNEIIRQKEKENQQLQKSLAIYLKKEKTREKRIEEKCRRRWKYLVRIFIIITTPLPLALVIFLYYFSFYPSFPLKANRIWQWQGISFFLIILMLNLSIILMAISLWKRRNVLPTQINDFLPKFNFIKCVTDFENNRIKSCVNQGKKKSGL